MAKAERFPVVAQPWVEHERGWGQRSDGFSLHRTEADRASFERAWLKANHKAQTAPDTYTQMDGTPFIIDVDAETYEELKTSKGIFVQKLPTGSRQPQ